MQFVPVGFENKPEADFPSEVLPELRRRVIARDLVQERANVLISVIFIVQLWPNDACCKWSQVQLNTAAFYAVTHDSNTNYRSFMRG